MIQWDTLYNNIERKKNYKKKYKRGEETRKYGNKQLDVYLYAKKINKQNIYAITNLVQKLLYFVLYPSTKAVKLSYILGVLLLII